jgi:hypothetical protein
MTRRTECGWRSRLPLSREIRVIPVLVDEAKMPSACELCPQRQAGAVDAILHYPDGRTAALEVSSTGPDGNHPVMTAFALHHDQPPVSDLHVLEPQPEHPAAVSVGAGLLHRPGVICHHFLPFQCRISAVVVVVSSVPAAQALAAKLAATAFRVPPGLG